MPRLIYLQLFQTRKHTHPRRISIRNAMSTKRNHTMGSEWFINLWRLNRLRPLWCLFLASLEIKDELINNKKLVLIHAKIYEFNWNCVEIWSYCPCPKGATCRVCVLFCRSFYIHKSPLRNQVHISLIVVDIIQFKGYRQGTKKLYNALSRSRSSAFGFIQLTSFRWETLKLLTS